MGLASIGSRSKFIIDQIIWMVVAGAIPIIIYRVIYGNWFLGKPVDPHLNDIKHITEPVMLVIPFIVLSIFCVFFIKEKRKLFSREIPNVILLLAGISFLVSVFPFSVSVEFGTSQANLNKTIGWSKDSNSSFDLSEEITMLLPVLMVLLYLLVIILMLYVAFKWGRAKSK